MSLSAFFPDHCLLPSVTFLGTASVTPDAGGDTASFMIGRTILVDTGWWATLKMLQYGFSPLEIQYLILTHCHHDHYIGLPHLLFYRRMKRHTEPLKIIGPADDLSRIVDRAQDFLQIDRFPEVEDTVELIPLSPGADFNADGFGLKTVGTLHAVQGLCYRFTDNASGRTFGFTGDTAYHPPIADHLQGCPFVVHEASHADRIVGNAAATGHSTAAEAARIAKACGAERLALVHVHRASAEAAVKAARVIFPGAFWPMDGEDVTF